MPYIDCTLCNNELTMLPYFGKRKQVTKVKFLVKEPNVSVISTDVNGISWCLTYHISWQDECWCIKFSLEEHTRLNAKTSITQILMVCHLLPFAKVGQNGSLINVIIHLPLVSFQTSHVSIAPNTTSPFCRSSFTCSTKHTQITLFKKWKKLSLKSHINVE